MDGVVDGVLLLHELLTDGVVIDEELLDEELVDGLPPKD